MIRKPGYYKVRTSDGWKTAQYTIGGSWATFGFIIEVGELADKQNVIKDIMDEFHNTPIELWTEPKTDECEIMIQAFAKVAELFECREWIMEGRGSYPYNDDRYREEVRYMYDEFDKIKKDTWANIKTLTVEYKQRIIAEYLLKEKLLPVKTVMDRLLLINPQIIPDSKHTNPFLYNHVKEWFEELEKTLYP